MSILQHLTFDEEVEEFVRRNKLSLLLMTTKNTSIVECLILKKNKEIF